MDIERPTPNETTRLVLDENRGAAANGDSEWASNSSRKLQYAANFKSSLVALVIFHHTAISYGGSGSMPYQSSQHPPESSDTLVGFNAINQTFFMASFFYVAGHFSRQNLKRKSSQQLIRDRLYRLGLPTLLYSLLGPPVCKAILLASREGELGSSLLFNDWKSVQGVRGQVWFTATLLMFDVAITIVQSLREHRKVSSTLTSSQTSQQKAGNHQQRVSAIGLFTGLAVCIASDFLIRILYPIDTIFVPLNLRIGYQSQYVASYALDTYARDIDFAILSRQSTAGLSVACIASSVCLIALLRNDPQAMDKLKSGWNAPAAVYAVWNNATGYLIGSSLLAAFSKFANASRQTIGDGAYPALLVHAPILTILGANTDGWKANTVLKTVVIGSAGVVASWAVGLGASELYTRLTSCSWKRPRRSETRME